MAMLEATIACSLSAYSNGRLHGHPLDETLDFRRSRTAGPNIFSYVLRGMVLWIRPRKLYVIEIAIG